MRKLILTLIGLTILTVAVTAQQAGEPAGAAQQTQVSSQEPVAVPEPSEKAISYYRSGIVLWVVGIFWGLLVPFLFLFTGLSARIRDLAQRIGRRRFFVIGIYFAIFSVLAFLIDLPLSYYSGYLREHAYGLSNQTFGKWASDSLTGLVLSIVFGFLFLWVPYALLRRSPRRWWLYTGLLMIPFLFLTVLIQPIWIDPLFNKFGPMRDKALESRILELADRAGIEGGRVFEVEKSVDTKAVNAYVTGFAGTKRIVLWDTIIARLDERELLFVMGHEMGHYVLGHVWKTIPFFALLIMVSLFAIHRTAGWFIRRYGERIGFTELSDIASLPLIILLFSVYMMIVMPIGLAFSRNNEREADRFGLEITRDNRAGAMAFVKLQEENLAVPRPHWLISLWRASHPTLGDRIDFCNGYRPWEKGEPLRYGDLFKQSSGR
ncbi:MAG: M48 family metallopeptidase [Acidobacteriota bacterium]|nr:MAG: M48 family metallopeptidase [Acidobacteriota bacterium]